MDKESINNLMKWLNEATDEEIDNRIKEIEAAKSRVTSYDGKADLRLALRLIDKEIIARAELNALSYKSQD